MPPNEKITLFTFHKEFYNLKAQTKLSKSYLNNYLDKLDPISKWIVIPRDVTGNQINTDESPFQRMKELFRLRNSLVHYKTKTIKIKNLRDDDWIREIDAEKANEAVCTIVEELKKIDMGISIDWLKSAGRDPYS